MEYDPDGELTDLPSVVVAASDVHEGTVSDVDLMRNVDGQVVPPHWTTGEALCVMDGRTSYTSCHQNYCVTLLTIEPLL
mgnify:CR=1 FL=1